VPKHQESDINNIEEGKPARKRPTSKKGKIVEKSRTDEQNVEPAMTRA